MSELSLSSLKENFYTTSLLKNPTLLRMSRSQVLTNHFSRGLYQTLYRGHNR